jgi:hypothetical protein
MAMARGARLAGHGLSNTASQVVPIQTERLHMSPKNTLYIKCTAEKSTVYGILPMSFAAV